MKHVNTKMILGIMIASVFLLGSVTTPVSALQSVIIEQSQNTAYAPGANNHTYIYASADDAFFQTSFSRLHLNEDVDLTVYAYDSSGWGSPDYSYSATPNMPFDWQEFGAFSNGPYGNPGLLPLFYDFSGSDGSGAVINTTLERKVFSLAFGQHTPVVVNRDYIYFGTFSVSGQEFVHLTVASLQDNIAWRLGIYDPQGRQMTTYTGSEGDIAVLPFRPSIAGTYYIIFEATPTSAVFSQFDFYLEAIAPQLISPGQVITDDLPTGEMVILDETGSLVHEEMAPTTHTYKIDAGTTVSSLHYSFNYPEIAIATTQGAAIIFSSDAFVYGYMGGDRFSYSITSPASGVQNFRSGIYYVTVMGGDNIEFTLYHESDVAETLPLGHEFLLENYFSHTVTTTYSLDLDSPSLIKVNSTEVAGAFVTYIRGANEDGYFVEEELVDGNSIPASDWTYIPAGKYLIDITTAASTSGFIEFNVGPIVSDSSADIVYIGGFMVPTIPGHYYNFSITLNNVYNVSSVVDVAFYDQYFRYVSASGFTMGTWYDGSTAIPHPTDSTNVNFALANRNWSDEFATLVIAVSPYNNTLGVGEAYPDYALDFTVEWTDITYYDISDNASIDVTGGPGSHNFTLPLLGLGVEYYSVVLDTVPGTWYNVSIKTGDISGIPSISEMAPYDHRTHSIPYGDLNDALVGVLPAISIQFGAISDVAYLDLRVNRVLVEEGFLWIQVTPLPTHALELLPHPPVGSDLLAMLGAIALPVGIGVTVIVVLAVVYLKKFKK
ncbi:MAG: hypothetical protein C4K48_11715 [Candidatus Thorarchaeota archaeon]|nr:MAG: hypothetical protein C4K48_11715 [Candidatus Thorarchaeota archaeon]